LRDVSRHVRGVHAALLDRQQQVLALAGGREGIDFLDDEIPGAVAHRRRQRRRTMRARQRDCAHARTRRHAAGAAMPSSRPGKPSVSLVVAFTLTASMSMPRSDAMFPRMAWACGPTFGP